MRSARQIVRRLRHDDSGFGLVELLIALTILVIGIMAIFAGFSTSLLTLQRAGHASTGATLGDKEMEKYRRVIFDQVPPARPSTTAFSSATTVSSASSPASPDGHTYWVGTDADWSCVIVGATLVRTAFPVSGPGGGPTCSGGGVASRAVKVVTVTVRDGTSTGRVLIRESSTFDEATG